MTSQIGLFRRGKNKVVHKELKYNGNCSYKMTNNLHKLRTYMVPHKVNYVHCNSCDLSSNTHVVKIH